MIKNHFKSVTSNLILSNINRINTEIYISLFNIYVRPIPEYCSILYSFHHLYLIDTIENVQRRYTKRLPNLYNLSYLQSLNACKTDSWELHRKLR